MKTNQTKARASPDKAARATTVTLNASTSRRQTFNDREYVVVPSIALVECVANGELEPASEFGRHAAAWDGRPVCVHHPEVNGVPISANSLSVMSANVGFLANSRLDGSKLKVDTYIDVLKCEEVGGETLEALRSVERGDEMDISVGHFCDLELSSGTYNGEAYSAIRRNHRPDHLALLPGGVGACSWLAGCGIGRTNQKEDGDVKVNSKQRQSKLSHNARFTANAVGVGELFAALEDAVAESVGNYWGFIIREVFPDEMQVVYQLEDDSYGYNGDTLRHAYTLDEATMSATLTGDAEPVVRRTTYEPLPATNSEDCDCKGDDMKKNERVSKLIKNSERFNEEDRGWLEAANEETLGALEAQAASQEDDEEAPQEEGEETEQAETVEAAMQALKKVASPDVVQTIHNALNKQDERRVQLVKSLAANAACAFDEKELKQMSEPQLNKLAKSLKTPDYSGNGMPVDNSQDDPDAPPAPPKVLSKRNAN